MNIEQKLGKFFENYKKRISVKQLIKKLKISSIDELLNALYELEKKGLIYKDEDDCYICVPKEFYLKHGILECSNKNNCYIRTKKGNVIIYKRDLKNAKAGDVVYYKIDSKDEKFNKYIGVVVRVVKKIEYKNDGNYIIKAKLKKDYKNEVYYIMNDKKKITIPFGRLNSAYPGDLVSVQVNGNDGSVVSVLSRVQAQHVFEYKKIDDKMQWVAIGTYSDDFKLINCSKHFNVGDRIIANINKNNEIEFVDNIDNGLDLLNQIKTIILDHGVNFDFPSGINDEIDNLSNIDDEISNRVDLRDLITFTIDPETAKDLDDAISIERLDDGYRLYVHIADVSYYVKFQTAIYNEAKRRCTSGYFANIVVSMLPTILSDNLCSLMPNEDKLAKTIVMDIDLSGKVKDFQIYKSVIRSNLKMTYDKVDSALSGTVEEDYIPFLNQLFDLAKLSKILEDNKMSRGYVGFKTDEYNFNIVNNEINVTSNNDGPAHLMIENSMLLANEYLTSYMHWLGLPLVYRNHEAPDYNKITSLKDDLKHYNYHVKTIKNATDPKVLQRVLLSITNSSNLEEVQFISKILLQYMQRAFYADKNVGHYGLALEYYSTFTSPIRRFPDLVNHLVLDSFLAGDLTIEEIKKEIPSICESVNTENLKIEQLEKSINNFLLKNYIGSCENNLKANIKIITKDGLYIKTQDGFFGLVSLPNLRYNYTTETAYIGDTEYRVEDEILVEMIDVNKDYEILFRICEKIEKRKKYEY